MWKIKNSSENGFSSFNQANLKLLIVKRNVTLSHCFSFLWIQLSENRSIVGWPLDPSAALSTTIDSIFCKMPNLQLWESESKDWKTFIICLHFSLSYKLDRKQKKLIHLHIIDLAIFLDKSTWQTYFPPSARLAIMITWGGQPLKCGMYK